MKLTLKLFYFAALLAAVSGCDNVDSDNRYIYVEPVEPVRKVLLEDFTGQNCVNCPDAHAIIDLLDTQYPETVIAVAIHGGDFAIDKSQTDFATNYIGLGNEEGEKLTRKANVEKWPAGMIDRKGGIKSFDQWATSVKDEVSLASNLNIGIEANCDSDSVYSTVTLSPQANISGKLNVWLVESNIIARQRTSSGNKRDYVHNHVLRACLTSIEGDNITLSDGIHSTDKRSIALRYNNQERWDSDNLAIVAFVEGQSGVEQVELAKVSLTE